MNLCTWDACDFHSNVFPFPCHSWWQWNIHSEMNWNCVALNGKRERSSGGGGGGCALVFIKWNNIASLTVTELDLNNENTEYQRSYQALWQQSFKFLNGGMAGFFRDAWAWTRQILHARTTWLFYGDRALLLYVLAGLLVIMVVFL